MCPTLVHALVSVLQFHLSKGKPSVCKTGIGLEDLRSLQGLNNLSNPASYSTKDTGADTPYSGAHFNEPAKAPLVEHSPPAN
jgi:hypothetical protein